MFAFASTLLFFASLFLRRCFGASNFKSGSDFDRGAAVDVAAAPPATDAHTSSALGPLLDATEITSSADLRESLTEDF